MNNNEELRKGSSVFFIELEKIEVNPYQPRIEFNEEKLNALAESIKQYGILQPIVVSRKEEYSEEFGIRTKYQIIAGERRFRASKIAGLNSIPAIIRDKEDTDAEKLELAIIENLQREDLNPVDKAKAFKKLADDFGLKHAQIAKKMGKSREYVSNAMRILMLPEQIINGLTAGKISEGHTRSLLMLKDRPNEQGELYKRIINDKLTVRAAEKLARGIATDKIRKKIDLDPEIKDIENHIREKLGTKVSIDQKPIGDGGKLTIEYFNKEDLRKILAVIESDEKNIVSNSDDSMSGIGATNFILEKEEVEKNNFDNIEPTVFKEEIERIEQFGNNETEGEESNAEFQGFSIGTNLHPEKEKTIVSPETEISIEKEEKRLEDDNLLVKKEVQNFDKDIMTEKDNLEGEAIDNFSSTGTLKNFYKEEEEEEEEESTTSKKNNSFQDEINTELNKISPNDLSIGLDEDYGKTKTYEPVDGFEKIEIKNDFDRSRINSFAKTDEILESFGSSKPVKNTLENNSISQSINLEENTISQQNIENLHNENVNEIENKFDNNTIITESKKEVILKESTKNEYSDLYADFLRSKGLSEDDVKKESSDKKNITINTMDNDLRMDAADNIIVEKSLPDLSQNMISDKDNVFQEERENIEPVVNIIHPSSEDFLAAAVEHKGEDEIINNDEDVDVKKDDKYSFKGFNI